MAHRQYFGEPAVQLRAHYRPFGLYRAVLALLVVVGHFIPAFIPNSDGFQPAIGSVGVYSFFVLSGFVISEAVSENYRRRPAPYFINRVLRILPPYLFALAVMIAVLLLPAIARRLGMPVQNALPSVEMQCAAWNLGALLDFRTAQGLEPCMIYVRYIWAVVVEVYFYVAVLATIIAGLVFGLRTAVRAALVLSMLAYFLDATGVYSIHPVVTYTPYFALGAAAFLFVNSRHNWLIFAAVGTAVTCLFYGRVASTDLSWLSMALMAVSMVAFGVLAHLRPDSALATPDAWLGNLSYPLYLNHYAVEVVFSYFLPRGGLVFAGAVVAALSLSVVAERIVEPATRPLRDWVRRRSVGTSR